MFKLYAIKFKALLYKNGKPSYYSVKNPIFKAPGAIKPLTLKL